MDWRNTFSRGWIQRITGSQDCNISRGDHRRSLVQLSLPAESALRSDQADKGLIQSGFESPQRWRLHHLSGQPVPLLECQHRDKLPSSCCGLTPASNKALHSCLLTPPQWNGGKNLKGKSEKETNVFR